MDLSGPSVWMIGRIFSGKHRNSQNKKIDAKKPFSCKSNALSASLSLKIASHLAGCKFNEFIICQGAASVHHHLLSLSPSLGQTQFIAQITGEILVEISEFLNGAKRPFSAQF